MMGNALFHLALADWRERSRRPAFWIALACMLGLALLLLPGPDANYHTVELGNWRGRYDSTWVGASVALSSLLLLPLLGFYLVKNAIARDEASGVGSLLAATGMGNGQYLAGKFLSNLAVLFSLCACLVLGSAGMQLWRGEATTLEPLALLAPHLFLVGPLLVLTAAFALLFETVPGLRGGAGNVLWFFLWLAALGFDTEQGLGLFRMTWVAESMQAQVRLLDPAYNGDFHVGLGVLTADGVQRQVFDWVGIAWTSAVMAERGLVALLAVPVLALALVGFKRFDRTRHVGGRAEPKAVIAAEEPRPVRLSALSQRRGFAFGRAVLGEWRLLRGRHGRFWWLLVAGLNAAALFVPPQGLMEGLVPALWLLPVLAWSELGNRAAAHRVDALVYATAAPLRHQVFAAWLAGVAYALAVVLGPMLVLAWRGQGRGLAVLAVGALFVPAMALASGLLSRGSKLFQALYCALWYVGVLNHAPGLDFVGAKPEAAAPLGFAVAAAGLLVLAWGTGALRLRLR